MNNKEDSQNPTFISLEDAVEMKTGTRITFVPGVQALYAEALKNICCLLYTSPSPRDGLLSRMPSSA